MILPYEATPNELLEQVNSIDNLRVELDITENKIYLIYKNKYIIEHWLPFFYYYKLSESKTGAIKETTCRKMYKRTKRFIKNMEKLKDVE